MFAEKRYQVFLSSTYEDLRKEREAVSQVLLQADCIPVGMELFPASDDTQWQFIQRVIAECDYYLVISAGRYGSCDEHGVSYTEKEYDYALQQGKPVLAFFHEDLDAIPAGQSESSVEGRQRLQSFREKLRTKLCRPWKELGDLKAQVALSINELKKSHPTEGWVRAGQVSDPQTVLRLQKRIDQLEAERSAPPPGIDQLAQGKDTFPINCRYLREAREHRQATSFMWDELIAALGPLMYNECSEHRLKVRLVQYVAGKVGGARAPHESPLEIAEDDFQTIKVQMIALGLIKKSRRRHPGTDVDAYWSLTPYGDAYVTQLKAVQRRPA